MHTQQEEIIIEFYYRSLKNDWNGFNFADALEEFRYGLQSKLDEHGLGSYEDYVETYEGIYGDLTTEMPECFTLKTDYIWFTKSDAVNAVMRAMYEHSKDTFSGMFDHLQEYVDGIDNPPGLLADKISLFDNIIHAQHETGDIFEDLDTEDLKDAAQEMYDADQENDCTSY